MKKLLLTVALLGVSVGAVGQSASASAGWVRVQAIAVGNKVRVTVASGAGVRKQMCIVSSLDADGISCAKGSAAVTFSRREIVKVEADHRARNTGVGAAVGAGVGLGIEQGFSHGWFSNSGKASAAAAAGGLGAILFGGIGYGTGWRTVYVGTPSAKP